MLALIKDNIMRIGKFIALTALATGLLMVGGVVVPRSPSKADNPIQTTQQSATCPEGTIMVTSMVGGCVPQDAPAPQTTVPTTDTPANTPVDLNTTSDTPTCH